MTLFVILIVSIALGLWAISRVPKAPTGDNVLTEAEALARDAAKAKSFLRRLWAWITADPKTDQEP